MNKIKNGIIVEIYRCQYRNGFNKLNSKNEAILTHPALHQHFEVSEEMPALKLVTRHLFGKDYIHAEPVEPGSYAMGGSFIYTCDSRFRELSEYPIPLHDRQMNLESR